MATSPDQPKKDLGSVFDLLPKSWEYVKRNWQMFAVVNIFAILSAIAAATSTDHTNNQYYGDPTANLISNQAAIGWGAIGLVFFLILIFATLFLYAMSVDLELRASQGERPDFNSLVEAGKKYWLRLLGLFIVGGLIVLVGLVLLIIPGLFAFYRLCLSPYLMVEKDLGIKESLKASNELVKQNGGPVLHALLLTFLIAVAVGIIASVPVVGPLVGTALGIAYSLVLVLRYHQVQGRSV